MYKRNYWQSSISERHIHILKIWGLCALCFSSFLTVASCPYVPSLLSPSRLREQRFYSSVALESVSKRTCGALCHRFCWFFNITVHVSLYYKTSGTYRLQCMFSTCKKTHTETGFGETWRCSKQRFIRGCVLASILRDAVTKTTVQDTWLPSSLQQ